MFPYSLVLLSSIVGTWYWLLAVHEAGHVLAAILTGGKVLSVNIPLLGFSHTNTSGGLPLAIVWAGLIVGAVVPGVAWLMLRPRSGQRSPRVLLAFFAAACLVGNGVYLVSGVGDAADLVRLGAPTWTCWITGVAMTAAGVPALRDARPLWMTRDHVPRSCRVASVTAAVLGIAVALIV